MISHYVAGVFVYFWEETFNYHFQMFSLILLSVSIPESYKLYQTK